MNILHIDMDAFFASIEIRDNPQLAGLPVVIAELKPRSVVSTCSYPAREYGIHSGMSARQAYYLCPNAFFISPRIDYYRTISKQIKKIFLSFTDQVEMFSLDEAYMDITNTNLSKEDPKEIAQIIQKKIYSEIGLTASIGVSYNKFLAKMGSDMHKPNGITIITMDNYQELLKDIPISKLYGVGSVTACRLRELGITTCKDLREMSKYSLYKILGTRGIVLYNNIRGVDNSRIITSRQQKSVSVSETFPVDKEFSSLADILQIKINMLIKNLNSMEMICRTVSICLRFSDFSCVSRQASFHIATNNKALIVKTSLFLLDKCCNHINKKIRLLEVCLGNLMPLSNHLAQQLSLFHLKTFF